jgi:hypothetical protein
VRVKFPDPYWVRVNAAVTLPESGAVSLSNGIDVRVRFPRPYYERVGARVKLKRVVSAEHLEEGFRRSIRPAHPGVSPP